MEVIVKLNNIPIVEQSFGHARRAYDRIKLHRLCWGVQHVENVVSAAAVAVHPAVQLLHGPIGCVDRVLCRSIDFVEQQVPAIYLPPEMMISNAREYMSDCLVRPVLRRADSVKVMRDRVLDNRVSAYAAHRLDGAIDVADKYVERFLPAAGDGAQNGGSASIDTVDGAGADGGAAAAAAASANGGGPVNALQKGHRFSRKLKRRLTQRTISEARALQQGAGEAVHIVRYAAELAVRDPLQAWQKAGELWRYLSADEPENQARPGTLEQLLVLVVRETARKAVHLVNFGAGAAARVPRNLLHSSTATARYYSAIFKARTNQLTAVPRWLSSALLAYIDQAQMFSTQQLERIARFLAGKPLQTSRTIANGHAGGS